MADIDVAQYLSDEDIARIVEEEVRSTARSWAKENTERVLSNAAYALVFKAVDDSLDGTAENTIRDKAIAVIKGMSAHTVFRPANAWDRDESLGWRYLQKAIEQYRPVLFQRVRSVIEEYPEERLVERVTEDLPTVLCDLVKRGAEV